MQMSVLNNLVPYEYIDRIDRENTKDTRVFENENVAVKWITEHEHFERILKYVNSEYLSYFTDKRYFKNVANESMLPHLRLPGKYDFRVNRSESVRVPNTGNVVVYHPLSDHSVKFFEGTEESSLDNVRGKVVRIYEVNEMNEKYGYEVYAFNNNDQRINDFIV